MQGIQEIVNKKVAAMVAEGTIQQVVEQSVEKAITKALANEFESFGSITKQIESAIKEGLQVNTRDMPFETYNEQMMVAIKGRMGAMFQGQAAEKFMAEMDKLLEPAPKEMTIEEFVETIVTFWKTDEPWDADELDEDATVEVCNAFDNVGIGEDFRFRMWKQRENKFSRYSEPELELLIMEGAIRINHKHRYNPTCFSKHEAFVFRLYAAGTVLTGVDEFDADECDLTLKELDY